MFKSLAIFILVLPLLFNVVLAQENDISPFANLSGNTDEGITKVQNYKVSDYKKALSEYNVLLDKYEKSYGERREDLKAELIIKIKSILFLKMGVVKARLEGFETVYNKIGFSDEKEKGLSDLLLTYNEFTSKKEKEVNDASSITDLESLSFEINKQIRDALYFINSYRVDYSVEESVKIINSLAEYIELIGKHLNVASEAGVDTSKIEARYANAVNTLNESKTRLKYLQKQADKNLTSSIIREVEDLVDEVVTSFYFIEDTVVSLQYKYGEIPWTLN